MQLPLHTYHCGPALEKGTANLSSFYPRGWRQIRYWRWHTSLQSFERRGKHTVGFSPKHGHFCPTFRDKIDESFWKFSNLTLVLLDFYSAPRSLVWKNEWNNWEMFTCSLRWHNFKSVNIFGKIQQCASSGTYFITVHFFSSLAEKHKRFLLVENCKWERGFLG